MSFGRPDAFEAEAPDLYHGIRATNGLTDGGIHFLPDGRPNPVACKYDNEPIEASFVLFVCDGQ